MIAETAQRREELRADEAGLTLSPFCAGSAPTAVQPGRPCHGPPDEQHRASQFPEIPGYELQGVLGRGGMAVVFKARQKALDRLVALKMVVGHSLNPGEFTRFRAEALALASLQHPNIIQIHEIGEFEGQPYLALEYAGGGSLSDDPAWSPAPPREAARLILTLATAVQTAHDRGILHRDLKPGNVLRTPDGTLKIADFGLAKRLDAPPTQTRTGAILGTPAYMAPEQAGGRSRDVGPGADIYALGALLYHCLTGRPPFLGETVLETIEDVRFRDPIPPRQLEPRIPRPIETICLKCLEKQPAKRYSSARELADDLRRFLDDEPIEARPVSSVERCWKWCRRHPSRAGLFAVTITALAVMAGAGGWFTHRLSTELRHTRVAHRALHEALNREIAERLDGTLRQLAAVPDSLAAVLSRRTDWDEAQIGSAVSAVLRERPRIFGMCVAFEPGQVAGRPDFALYVHRTAEGLQAKQLLPPSYLPLYREWPWYREARSGQTPTWGEPYIGPGGDNTPMVSYSSPITRDGQFAGVVTIDLALEFFQTLPKSLENLESGVQAAYYVITRDGTFLRHPDPARQFPAPVSELHDPGHDPALRDLAETFAREPRGTAFVVDPGSSRPALVIFDRVPSSGWVFVSMSHSADVGSPNVPPAQ